MKIFVDSANLLEIEEALERGFPSGITTNPSILAKEEKADFREHINKIIELVQRYGYDIPLSVEVFSTRPEEMISQAEDFVGHFAGDVDPARARVLHAVQQGLSMSTFEDVMGIPAWKSHPSWYLVATNDEAIPSDAERMFAQRMGATTVEVPSGHLAMISHPDEVVKLINAAAFAARDRPGRDDLARAGQRQGTRG